MKRERFIIKEENNLIKAVQNRLPFLSNYQIEKILNRRDIKVNGIRVKADTNLAIGDKIELFHNYEEKPWFEIVYQDENVIVINKKCGIEVISETDRDVLSILKNEIGETYPIHRIDRNTEGLVIFAKNQMAEKELLEAFKTRKLSKRYLLEVVGKIDAETIKERLFLKKLSNVSKVLISEVKTSGFDEIKTKFKHIKFIDNNTILEAELITGKTHQIRAHISYYGHSIVGDGKYGKGDGKLHLTAYFIKFNLPQTSKLAYLNNIHFEIMPTWINI
ncbi:MAG: RluA family pseudouridine synthase [Clostridia bacterium]|nr:RluA family pseudouridine synthase [Clostridia bacterium]